MHCTAHNALAARLSPRSKSIILAVPHHHTNHGTLLLHDSILHAFTGSYISELPATLQLLIIFLHLGHGTFMHPRLIGTDCRPVDILTLNHVLGHGPDGACVELKASFSEARVRS